LTAAYFDLRGLVKKIRRFIGFETAIVWNMTVFLQQPARISDLIFGICGNIIGEPRGEG
jgi:hypothetical protein